MVRNMNGAGNGNYRSNGYHRNSRRGGRGSNYQPYRYQQQHFPKLPDHAGDENLPETLEDPQEQPPTPTEVSTPFPPEEEPAVSPVPGQNESQSPVGLVWHGVPPNFKMDPNQLFVLTGPFDDNGSTSYEAHPVPKGATVFATPAVTAPYWPSGNDIVINFQGNSLLSGPNANGFNPKAAPFFPQKKTQANDEVDNDDNKEEEESDEALEDGGSDNSNEEIPNRNPSMTVFNAMFPKGKAFPLRQPQPPVYFQTPIYPEMMEHSCDGESGDHAGKEENNNQPTIPAKEEKSTTQMLSVEV